MKVAVLLNFSRKPNKIVPCKHAGQESHLRADGSSTAMRGKDGEVGGWTHKGQPTQDTRIPDSVIRVMRHKGKIGQDIDHPAVFPVALPEFAIEAYTEAGDIVFEPFGGSGTTMLAAQRTGRVCRSVEIAPEYVDVAIQRFRQNHPDVAITLLAGLQTISPAMYEAASIDGANERQKFWYVTLPMLTPIIAVAPLLPSRSSRLPPSARSRLAPPRRARSAMPTPSRRSSTTLPCDSASVRGSPLTSWSTGRRS